MRYILVFLALNTFWNAPAFSQGAVGDPPPDAVLKGIPDDKPNSGEGLEPGEKGSGSLRKSMAFFRVGNTVKRLVKEVNSNVVNTCHKENPKITGIKSLVVYLVKREAEEKVNTAMSVNQKVGSDCKNSALDCVFKDSLRIFSKLIHQRNFVPYLTEMKGWKKEDAEVVTQYLISVETKLKPKP